MFPASGILILLFLGSPPGSTIPTQIMAWRVLRAGLTDSDPIKRSEAVTAAGSLGRTGRAVSLVAGGLADKHPLVRQTAAAVLGQMGAYRAILGLRQALSDKVPAVRFAAARSLWRLKDHGCRSYLIGVLSGQQKTSNPLVRAEIRTAERDMRDPSSMAKIGITQGAAALLGPYGIGLGVAERMFTDQNAVGRALTARLLASGSDPETFAALEGALLDRDPGVRAAAARALNTRSERRAVPDLEPLLYDKSSAPRFMAAAAIIRLTTTRKRRGRARSAHRARHANAEKTRAK